MNRLMLLAMASIIAGLVVGAAVILGVTRVAERGARSTFTQDTVQESTLNEVQYGDRCIEGHCLSSVPTCWNGHCMPRCIHGHCL